MAKRKKHTTTTWNIDDLSTLLARQLAAIIENLHPYQQELGGALLFALSLLVFLNLVGLTGGALPTALGNLTGSLFGWGAIPIVVSIGALSVFLISRLFTEEPIPLPLEKIIGVELIFISGLVLIHLFAGGDDPLALAERHGGGGFIGWGLSTLVSNLTGHSKTIPGILFVIIGLAGIGLLINTERLDLERWTEPAIPPTADEVADDATNNLKTTTKVKAAPKPRKPRQPKPSMSADQAIQAVGQTEHKFALPPLELLAPAALATGRSANARLQAQVIEETLNGFGVPAEVVEINPGPTVTQFGVKPGTIEKKLPDGTSVQQRVRVSKINSLNNDLALALAAAPIRIETPVPGRPIVGIEVPNTAVSVVSLRGAMETDTYRRAKGTLPVALGKGVGGTVVVADLTSQPHLLIAGATGSGKSVCINATIINLLMTHTPDKLKLLMIDPKMVELTSYNGIPHLIAPVVTDFEQVAGALAWVTREMERRYKAFASIGARNIKTYNQKVKSDEQLPFMVVIIDELADLMMLAADEIEKYIARIAQMARATGIHMIIATQRPSTDVVTGLIKANFPARIAFAVSSQVDSRVILDTPGAEKLLGKGDMLYQAPDSPKLARLQGCFVSDAEIKNVVQYWKWASTPLPTPNDENEDATSTATTTDNIPAKPAAPQTQINEPPAVPWADILKESHKDDMLERAIKLVVENQRASTSFLQRKLGIGYPRASRLMDQLEEQGIVGPADGTHHREVYRSPEPDDEIEIDLDNDLDQI